MMLHAPHTPFHDMLQNNRIINKDVISPNVLTEIELQPGSVLAP